MKRSRSLKLALMSASVLTVAACDKPEEVAIFENLEQCINEAGFEREVCEAHLNTAKQEHVRVSPKYTSAADCEADFGAAQCEVAPQQTSSGGSVFMPLMMGYMMGNMLAGNSRVATQPLYRSKDNPGNFRTADNQKVAGKTGISKVPSSVTKAPTTKTRTTRRNGFGATAARNAGRVRSFGG
ncbi:MAG: DUF1190 domain-containing protein [Alphaproteobacteria bacterium]|nr:DUF1190 domain-containing protein [Alphaproteobacteria bacterium]